MSYFFAVQTHEATIFKISGRVDFLYMPILDRIESKVKEWWTKDIVVVKAANDTVDYIMQNHFLQQQPLKIEGYADFLGVRKRFYYDVDTQYEFKDRNRAFIFANCKQFATSVLTKPYEFLRDFQGDDARKKQDIFIVYDNQVLSREKEHQKDYFLYKQNPFNYLLEIEQLVYGESVMPFRILAKKTKGKSKMI
mmetsp:Transcript_17034/g.19638  ORF Transcript_17034/g.19638 Transcript_17034/m.19638 type:complete len:194 (+) Transcript_17034:110-691(+)